MQHKIEEKKPLLDRNGCLTEAGYATSLILDYNRQAIKAGKTRIKEWDYYYIGNEEYGVALTIADNSYMGVVTATVLDFRVPEEITTSIMTLLPMGKTSFPATSEIGNIGIRNKRLSFRFLNNGKERHLICKMKKFDGNRNFSCDIILTEQAEDSMVIATPFLEKKTAFYYNQKINCMRAVGHMQVGRKIYNFKEKDSFAVLDWGRGAWTYDNTWYWGSASGVVDGVDFGFNIGYGFGDTSAASENMLFYDGKAHKLEKVAFHIPKQKDGSEDYMSPWTFTSSDGRFEMDFEPVIDRYSMNKAAMISSCQHQVFGKFTGKVILEDSKEIQINQIFGFAEKVRNKW